MRKGRKKKKEKKGMQSNTRTNSVVDDWNTFSLDDRIGKALSRVVDDCSTLI